MILCIEDSPADSSLLYQMLRISTDRALIFVTSQKAALRAIAKLIDPPALILCDLLMEGNGYVTIAFLRQHYPNVPVVVVTGAEDSPAIPGVHAVIQKGTPGLSIRLEQCLVELHLLERTTPAEPTPQ